jgi:gamma-glutamyltranspeptidase/glutathione hydrolase
MKIRMFVAVLLKSWLMSMVIISLALIGECPADEPPTRSEAGSALPPIEAEGHEGLVIGLTGPRAVHAGIQVLKQGGSASDAAVAAALTQIVEAAGSYISFAGILSMMHYEASSGKVQFLNACYNTPIEETDPLSIPALDLENSYLGEASGRTALVPGFMGGVQAAHDRFGKLPLAELFKPAIKLADDGFEVDPLLAYYIQFRKNALDRLPETKRVFTKENGEFYAAGDLFRQPELAATLRQAAAQGGGYFYTGEWARRFVDTVRREGGRITDRDLTSYRVIWEDPLETTYRAAHIFAPGLSSDGGVDTVEALNLVELAELRRFGPASRSPQSLFWLMQITNNQNLSLFPGIAAERFPKKDFSPKVRATKEHAQWIWRQMQEGKWPYGEPARTDKSPGHSSGVVTVDRWGNVASLTHSINTVVWGATGIFVAGISIPDSAAFQQEAIQRAGPGQRLRDPMAPLIVTRDGSPVLASSAIGAAIHQRNIQVLANVLEFDMDAQAAIEEPAFLPPKLSGAKSIARVGEGAFKNTLLDGVKELGQMVEIVNAEQSMALAGFWAGVEIDPKTGGLRSAGAGQSLSHAEGY